MHGGHRRQQAQQGQLPLHASTPEHQNAHAKQFGVGRAPHARQGAGQHPADIAQEQGQRQHAGGHAVVAQAHPQHQRHQHPGQQPGLAIHPGRQGLAKVQKGHRQQHEHQRRAGPHHPCQPHHLGATLCPEIPVAIAQKHQRMAHEAGQPQGKQGEHRIPAHHPLNQCIYCHRAQHAHHQALQLVLVGFLLAKGQRLPQASAQRDSTTAFYTQHQLFHASTRHGDRKHHHVGADLTPKLRVAPPCHPGDARPHIAHGALAELHVFQSGIVQNQPVSHRLGAGVA